MYNRCGDRYYIINGPRRVCVCVRICETYRAKLARNKTRRVSNVVRRHHRHTHTRGVFLACTVHTHTHTHAHGGAANGERAVRDHSPLGVPPETTLLYVFSLVSRWANALKDIDFTYNLYYSACVSRVPPFSTFDATRAVAELSYTQHNIHSVHKYINVCVRQCMQTPWGRSASARACKISAYVAPLPPPCRGMQISVWVACTRTHRTTINARALLQRRTCDHMNYIWRGTRLLRLQRPARVASVAAAAAAALADSAAGLCIQYVVYVVCVCVCSYHYYNASSLDLRDPRPGANVCCVRELKPRDARTIKVWRSRVGGAHTGRDFRSLCVCVWQ